MTAPIPSVATEMTSEIALDRLRETDQIEIGTANSTYIFLVTDPAKRLGLLIGGVLGNYAALAILELFPVAHESRLREGGRVRFLIESGAGHKLLTTSAITRLVHRRAGTGLTP